MNKYNPELAIRFSTKNLVKQDKIINIPLYLIWNIKETLKLNNL